MERCESEGLSVGVIKFPPLLVGVYKCSDFPACGSRDSCLVGLLTTSPIFTSVKRKFHLYRFHLYWFKRVYRFIFIFFYGSRSLNSRSCVYALAIIIKLSSQ